MIKNKMTATEGKRMCNERTPTKPAGVQHQNISQRERNEKMSDSKSEVVGNLLIRNILCFKLGKTEKTWFWPNSWFQRKAQWLKDVLLFFSFLCEPVSPFSQLPLDCFEPNALSHSVRPNWVLANSPTGLHKRIMLFSSRFTRESARH